MNNFSTKNVDTSEKRKVSQFFGYGVKELCITAIDVKTAASGRKMVSFKMEGHKVKEEGWQPHPDAKLGGQIGNVQFTIYIDEKDNKAVDEVVKNVGIIADKLNVREKVDAIEAGDLESYFKALYPVVRGKYAWWRVTASEYEKQDGKIGYTLGLSRFGFVASLEEGESHLRPFDKSNQYDYRTIAAPSKDPDVDPITEAFGDAPDDDDLPWN